MSEPLEGPARLGVGVVGFGWMGQVHARAFSRLRHHYPQTPLTPELVAVADTAPDDRVLRAVSAYGFEHRFDDWRDLVAHPDVDVVCVSGPNHIHRDVAVAAAQAGKHVWVEKPAGRNAAETAEIVAAVAAAGVRSAVGFNYRNAPAVETARALVAEGRLGRLQHTVVRFASDYSAHPQGALTWRFRNEYAGSGVLGDLVSHATDLLRYVVGEIDELVADVATFIPQRPAAAEAASHFSLGGDGPLLPVENEDWVSALIRLRDGSRAVLESCRTEVGDQCAYSIEVHGSHGALAWDFRRMGELRVCLDQDFADAAWTTRWVGVGDAELAAFQPGTGIAMSYDDLKVIEAHRLVESIAGTGERGADIRDALAAALTVEAIAASARTRSWQRVGGERA